MIISVHQSTFTYKQINLLVIYIAVWLLSNSAKKNMKNDFFVKARVFNVAEIYIQCICN